MDFISPDTEIVPLKPVFTEMELLFALLERLVARVATVLARPEQELAGLERLVARVTTVLAKPEQQLAGLEQAIAQMEPPFAWCD